MITGDIAAFMDRARTLQPIARGCAKALFLIAPEGFALAAESASDNRYMDMALSVDGARAMDQHRGLQRALASIVPTIAFPGDPATPDAVFPNNVFATVGSAQPTAPGKILLARMRHPVRQREAERTDIRSFFTDVLGYAMHDLRLQAGVGELTGSLVIDRGRGLGFCGLSERCDVAGAAAMHAAFGLRATLLFKLAPGEYHTNVVLSVLDGRAASLCPDGFADAAVVDAIAALYAPHVVLLDNSEKLAFAGNCIAATADTVWMSEVAADALRPVSRKGYEDAGFDLHSVPLDEIEKAGGSLRCCVGEIF